MKGTFTTAEGNKFRSQSTFRYLVVRNRGDVKGAAGAIVRRSDTLQVARDAARRMNLVPGALCIIDSATGEVVG